MNREIKFRIWCNNRFYYKCLVGNTTDTNDKNWTCPMVWLEDKKEWVNCDNGIISQYTGLKDKNGAEIYEGDIIKIHYFYEGYDLETFGAVELEKDISGIVSLTTPLGIHIDTKDESQNYLSEYLYNLSLEEYPEQLEVIGNIYESEVTNE